MVNALQNALRGDVSTSQAFHRSLGPQSFEWIYIVCDQMVQADTGVHQPRDENSTPHETRFCLYRANRCFGVKYRLALLMTAEAELLRGQLGFAFQTMTMAEAILSVINQSVIL